MIILPLSPKNTDIHISKINELKIVSSYKDIQSNLNKYNYLIYKYNIKNLYIQSINNENLNDFIGYIKLYPQWKLSIRLHKLINIK